MPPSVCIYSKCFLHPKFKFIRPLTVTGAFICKNSEDNHLSNDKQKKDKIPQVTKTLKELFKFVSPRKNQNQSHDLINMVGSDLLSLPKENDCNPAKIAKLESSFAKLAISLDKINYKLELQKEKIEKETEDLKNRIISDAMNTFGQNVRTHTEMLEYECAIARLTEHLDGLNLHQLRIFARDCLNPTESSKSTAPSDHRRLDLSSRGVSQLIPQEDNDKREDKNVKGLMQDKQERCIAHFIEMGFDEHDVNLAFEVCEGDSNQMFDLLTSLTEFNS
ncbi:Oidioi.mRNA.OKI2018_I69.chr1.g1493.t3.cds [Oikopleura dioica]|uniref:Oidioi.mRNA.OKI2018_I69.chr1.g1493.t3.cds n=1 Tax=Oikopleura dioica TaxID=34765 RepID=A0ABN7SRY2_OIKDI|nr:Oidioi.mRNA.OKI2018_I69.chr1.g1493.t3.cds [Oikopleura dioica]